MNVSQIATNPQVPASNASLEAKRVQLQALMLRKALDLQQAQAQPATTNEEAEGKGQLLDIRC